MMGKLLENNIVASLLLAFALVLISVLLLNRAFQSTMDGVEWQEWVYRVQEGDSLWSLSGVYCPGHVDRREWVEEVIELNDLPNGNIRPGQEIIVLVAPIEETTDK